MTTSTPPTAFSSRPVNNTVGDAFPAPAPVASGATNLSAFQGLDPNGDWKLFIVDDAWALIGSANWDARSFRLNFELDVEVQDEAFAQKLAQEFARKRDASRELTLAEVDARRWPTRLRDGTARLFLPYL